MKNDSAAGMKVVAWRKLSYRSELLTKAIPGAKLWFLKGKIPYIHAMIMMVLKCLIHKPHTLIVQLPQGLLLFEAILLKKLFKNTVIADVHTGFLISSGLKGYFLNKIFVQFLNSTDLVLVHNENMKSLVSPAIIKKTIVVYDPWMFIDTPEVDSKVNNNDEYLVFPASFAHDEPLEEVCEAINSLREIKLIVTGKYSRQPDVLRFKSKYVQFVGYLPRKDYDKLLINSSGIVTGSTREFTLCMSSWEAVAYNKPLILTNTRALKNTFKDYATFFDWKTHESIVSALKSNNKIDLSKPREQLFKLTEDGLQQLLIRPEIRIKN